MKNREFLDNMIDYLHGKDEIDLEANYFLWKDDINDRMKHGQSMFDLSTIKEISEGVFIG